MSDLEQKLNIEDARKKAFDACNDIVKFVCREVLELELEHLSKKICFFPERKIENEFVPAIILKNDMFSADLRLLVDVCLTIIQRIQADVHTLKLKSLMDCSNIIDKMEACIETCSHRFILVINLDDLKLSELQFIVHELHNILRRKENVNVKLLLINSTKNEDSIQISQYISGSVLNYEVVYFSSLYTCLNHFHQKLMNCEKLAFIVGPNIQQWMISTCIESCSSLTSYMAKISFIAYCHFSTVTSFPLINFKSLESDEGSLSAEQYLQNAALHADNGMILGLFKWTEHDCGHCNASSENIKFLSNFYAALHLFTVWIHEIFQLSTSQLRGEKVLPILTHYAFEKKGEQYPRLVVSALHCISEISGDDLLRLVEAVHTFNRSISSYRKDTSTLTYLDVSMESKMEASIEKIKDLLIAGRWAWKNTIDEARNLSKRNKANAVKAGIYHEVNNLTFMLQDYFESSLMYGTIHEIIEGKCQHTTCEINILKTICFDDVSVLNENFRSQCRFQLLGYIMNPGCSFHHDETVRFDFRKFINAAFVSLTTFDDHVDTESWFEIFFHAISAEDQQNVAISQENPEKKKPCHSINSSASFNAVERELKNVSYCKFFEENTINVNMEIKKSKKVRLQDFNGMNLSRKSVNAQPLNITGIKYNSKRERINRFTKSVNRSINSAVLKRSAWLLFTYSISVLRLLGFISYAGDRIIRETFSFMSSKDTHNDIKRNYSQITHEAEKFFLLEQQYHPLNVSNEDKSTDGRSSRKMRRYTSFHRKNVKKNPSTEPEKEAQKMSSISWPSFSEVEATVRYHNKGKYANDTSSCESEYEKIFKKWNIFFSIGFSVLVYGLGSKIQILRKFIQSCSIKQSKVIQIHAYRSNIDIKVIIKKVYDHFNISYDNVGGMFNVMKCAEMLRCITAKLTHSVPLIIVIHSIDGGALRSREYQKILSTLASCSQIFLIASADHINVNLLWDSELQSRFNWIWQFVATYQPYIVELRDNYCFHNRRETTDSPERTSKHRNYLTEIIHVLQGLTPRHTEVLKILARMLLNQKSRCYQVLKSDWADECSRKMIKNRQLQPIIVQLQDHGLIHFVVEKSSYVTIPFEDDMLQAIISFDYFAGLKFLKNELLHH